MSVTSGLPIDVQLKIADVRTGIKNMVRKVAINGYDSKRVDLIANQINDNWQSLFEVAWKQRKL